MSGAGTSGEHQSDLRADLLGPDYSRTSLADVVPAVARALGRPFHTDPQEPVPGGLDLPPASAYVVFLVDGLGARLLERHADDAPYLASLAGGASTTGTACVPSTTATSLTSLGTGLPPGTHGIVGFTSRVPGTHKLLNALQWSKNVDPLQWQPHPTAFARLQEDGVEVSVVNKREFEGSGLTVAAQRGATYVGADRTGERITAGVARSRATPSLTYLYDSDLDWTGHRYGVDSEAWLQQLAMIDHQAEQLRDALPDRVRLLVLADHGMVDSAPDDRTDVDAHPELRDGLALLGGEARFRHLYCDSGAADDVAATWAEVLGDHAHVLARDEAISLGWFGDVTSPVLPRLGDVVVAARGSHGIFSSVDFAYETTLVGLHGSLTPDEMSIPVLVD